MKQKLLGIGILILMLLLASSALPASGMIKEPKYYEMQPSEQIIEPTISHKLDIAINPITSSVTTSQGLTFFIYEGQKIKIWITGNYTPPNPTKQICLWADNTTIPSGATVTPECNCDYGNVTSLFEWPTSPGQAGTYVVTFYLGESCYEPCCYLNITIIVLPSGEDDPPIVTIYSPIDETTVNDPEIIVIGYATDDNELTSFGRRHEWIGGQEETSSTFPSPGPTEYSFEEDFILFEGWNRITIYVSDSEGQNAQDQIVINYEIQPNQPPFKPAKPVGPSTGKIGLSYQYVSYVSDPDGDQMEVLFDWGDGTNTSWIGPISSGSLVEAYHTYTAEGTFSVKIKARDIPEYNESVWSDSLPVRIPKNKPFGSPILRFLENHPQLYPLLRLFLQIG